MALRTEHAGRLQGAPARRRAEDPPIRRRQRSSEDAKHPSRPDHRPNTQRTALAMNSRDARLYPAGTAGGAGGISIMSIAAYSGLRNVLFTRAAVEAAKPAAGGGATGGFPAGTGYRAGRAAQHPRRIRRTPGRAARR
jgi:hypothetical protein